MTTASDELWTAVVSDDEFRSFGPFETQNDAMSCVGDELDAHIGWVKHDINETQFVLRAMDYYLDEGIEAYLIGSKVQTGGDDARDDR